MSLYNDGKSVYEKDDFPIGPHYAILEFSSVLVPGDERSRTCPGHGYPEHTESVVRYIVFPTKEDWENEIKTRMDPPKWGNIKNNWVPIKADVAKISVDVSVSVKMEES